MSLYDETLKKIPDYYSTMYQDGFEQHEILMAMRRQMHQDIEERANPEPPTNIHIISEVKTK